MAPPGAYFPATHWTLIAQSAGPSRDAALAQLYRIYWRPLRAQVRRFGVPEQDAEDVIQEFLLHLFEAGSLQRANPAAGRFRSYLVGALRYFLSHRRTREQAQKRGGGAMPLPIDQAAEDLIDPAPLPGDTWQWDGEWARALLDHALARFAEETRASDASEGGALLQSWVFGEETLSYEQAAEQLGITVPALKSRVFRVRQRFRQIVREEVARTVADPADGDAELRYLCTVLEKAEGAASSRALA